MGYTFKNATVTKVTIGFSEGYIPGTRLKVIFDGGEELFFREVRQRNGVTVILDTELSSKVIVEKLFAASAASDLASVFCTEPAMPLLRDVLNINELSSLDTDRYFFLSRGFELTEVIIGEELQGWKSSYYSSGGTGISFYPGHVVSSVYAVVIDGAP